LLPETLTPKLTPQFPITIQSHKFNALLDTGASHSFMQLSIAQSLKLSIVHSSSPEITIGNSCKIKPVGSCTVSFRFANKLFKVTLYIAAINFFLMGFTCYTKTTTPPTVLIA
jgi:hypothetical protein